MRVARLLAVMAAMTALGAGGIAQAMSGQQAPGADTHVRAETAPLSAALALPRVDANANTTAGPRRLNALYRHEGTVSLHPLAGLTVRAGRNFSQASPLGAQSARDYDGLFALGGATLSPYAALSDGGGFIAAAIKLASELRFHVAAATLTPDAARALAPAADIRAVNIGAGGAGALLRRQADAAQAGLTWDFAKWGSLGLTASQTQERTAILSDLRTGAPALSRTNEVGLTARFKMGDGWVTTFSYHEGATQLALRPNYLSTGPDTLRGRTYGIAVAKHGLFSDNDSVGLALTRPGPIYSGGIDLGAPTGVDLARTLVARNLPLGGGKPETDVELGYVTTFFDGALALQANAGYQMNLAGQSGKNAVTVLSRAKINF